MGHQYHDLQYWCKLGEESEKNDIDGCVEFMFGEKWDFYLQ